MITVNYAVFSTAGLQLDMCIVNFDRELWYLDMYSTIVKQLLPCVS